MDKGAIHRHSHYHADMYSVEEARSEILAKFETLDAISVPITEAIGMVLSTNVESGIDIPPFNNSSMDGYAVKADDLSSVDPDSPTYLEVTETIAAGTMSSNKVQPGTAMRIMTGAPIPDGSDAVVPFEDTTEMDSDFDPLSTKIGVKVSASIGQNIRLLGKDVSVGDEVLSKGTNCTYSVIGVLASLGFDTVKVHRRPVVAVLSTGDELVNPGEPITPGKIYDSNSSSLIGAILQSGGIPKYVGIARDNLDSVKDILTRAMDSDLVISSAGVSKGDYDMVKQALDESGDLDFWSVRMRPAKPLAFGLLNRGDNSTVPLVGLPGNAVSSLVALEQFCRPAIRKMLGKTKLVREHLRGILTGAIHNYDGRRVYARVNVESDGGKLIATPTVNQDSNILTSMARANAFAICPEDESVKNAGDSVDLFMLDREEESVT